MTAHALPEHTPYPPADPPVIDTLATLHMPMSGSMLAAVVGALDDAVAGFGYRVQVRPYQGGLGVHLTEHQQQPAGPDARG